MPENGNNMHGNFSEEYEKISPQEQTVIDRIEGVTKLTVAPATRVSKMLALRFVKILSHTNTNPENLLCFTIADSSAIAFKARLRQFIGASAAKVNIYTVDSFCESFVCDNNSLFENKSRALISTVEEIKLFKKLITGFTKNNPLKRYRSDVYNEINNLKTLFFFMKREGYTAEYLDKKIDTFLAGRHSKNDLFAQEKMMMEKLRAAIKEFDQYQQLLQINNRDDAYGLVDMVVKALEENKKLLSAYQRKYTYIQLDGYNLFSEPARKLLQLLLNNNEHPNILLIDYDEENMAVPQKSKTENTRLFQNRFLNTWEVVMLCNDYNHSSGHQPINKPVVKSYTSIHEEMAAITNQVYELLQQDISTQKIAIVYQADEYCATLEKYFILKNIPFCSARSLNILNGPFIKKIIKLLRYINTENDVPNSGDGLLFEILHLNFFNVPPTEIARLAAEVNSKKYSATPTGLRKLLREKATAPPKDLFDTGIHKDLKNAGAFVEKLISDVHNSSLQQIFERIVKDALVINYIDQNENSTGLMQLLATLSEFIKKETTRDPLLQLNELIEVIDIMERERLPLNMRIVQGSTSDVNIIKTTDIKERHFEYTFIAGATTISVENQDWLGAINQLTIDRRTTYSGTHIENQPGALYHLCVAMLAKKETHLFISFAKYGEQGVALYPAAFVTKILSHYSVTVKNVALKEIELTNYTRLFTTKWLPEIAHPEAAFITPLVNKFVMNVSALNSYLNCPLGFYYNNIIRIAAGKSEAMEFGSAIHYALENLFKKMLVVAQAATVKQTDHLNHFPSAELLVEDFTCYMNNHRVQFSKEAFERRMRYGDKVLRNYYDHYIHKWNKVASVERNIRGITINGVPMKGKLDKLEFNGKEVTIVDYKSGDIEKAVLKMQPPNEAALNGGDYWRQAVFYTLLVNNYDKKDWRVVSAEFDFIEPDEKKQYRKEKILITPADIETVKQQLTYVWNKIQSHQFYTGCGKADCHWCNFVKDNKLAVALHDKELGGR